MGRLAGREAGIESVSSLLAAAASGPAVLVVDGEAGIGKTTLCREAVRLARLSGFRVLHCRPTAAESALSFAGLTDLLFGVDDAMVEALPSPQRTAVNAAVLRADPPPTDLDERAVGTGLATLLAHCAESGPVFVAIDDAQWLDPPSQAAVTFALRRVRSIPMGVLVCSRPASAGASELEAAMPDPGWVRRFTLPGMDDAELFHVVRERLGVSLSPPQLARIGAASAGNPYVAVELARAAVSKSHSTTEDLPVPQTLQSLVAEQLVTLSPGACEAILAVACAARPTPSLLAKLNLREPLEEAEAQGVVVVARGRVEFTHPLLAAAALGLASPPAVRSMHARLSRVVEEAEAVARHRALAVPEPDDAVAAALDVAVDSAAARGAAITALDLARLALERTVDTASPAAWERRVRLAERLHVSGATLEAGRVLDGLAGGCPPGPIRGRGWLLLTEVAYQTSSTEQAVRCARAALADATEPALSARAWLSLAALSSDADDTARHVAAARACLDESDLDAPELEAWVACEEVTVRFLRGHGLDREALDRALALERSGRVWRSGDQVASIRPVLLKWADYPADALAELEDLRAKAREEGNDGLLPYVGGHIPGILLRMGRTHEAAAAAAQHLADAEATGQESQRVQALYNTALVDGHLGLLDAAWKAADEIATWADREHDAWMQMSASGVSGFVALCRDDVRTSRIWFDRWAAHCEALGVVDPGISRHHGDHVEVLLATGAASEAADRTEDLRNRARRARRLSAAAVAARCEGLVAIAAGDPDSAVDHLVEALRLHRLCDVPFEQARTLLAAGVAHRRAKRKHEARTFLGRAVDSFAQLGAATWAARAQSELERVVGRPRPPVEQEELTATEHRVAELAARGLTNRQVAERAHISPKTVESNLARAYRKLGISSRAELGALMAPASGTSRADPS